MKGSERVIHEEVPMTSFLRIKRTNPISRFFHLAIVFRICIFEVLNLESRV